MWTGRTVAATAVLSVLAATGGAAGGRALHARQAPAAEPVAAATSAPPVPSAPSATPLTAQERLERVKAATVRLSAPGEEFSGSGTLVSSTGLVLTNAHVAAPQAPGLARRYGPTSLPDPEHLVVSVNGPDDGPAVPRYRARVLLVDGVLDLAVLQVDALADGSALPPGSRFPSLGLGDSAALRVGQPLTVVGYPAVANGGRSVSVTTGTVASIGPDPLGLVEGDRFELDTDARTTPGNSGGAAVDAAGDLVGVPSAGLLEEDDSGRVRPVDFALPLLDLAARGEGEAYRSPLLEPADDVLVAAAWAADDDPCAAPAPGGLLPAEAALLVVGVVGEGLREGLDLQFRLTRDGEPLHQEAHAVDEQEEVDGCARVAVDVEGLSGRYEVEVLAGPDRRPVARSSAVAPG